MLVPGVSTRAAVAQLLLSVSIGSLSPMGISAISLICSAWEDRWVSFDALE